MKRCNSVAAEPPQLGYQSDADLEGSMLQDHFVFAVGRSCLQFFSFSQGLRRGRYDEYDGL